MQQKQAAVLGHRGHIAAAVRRGTDGIVHLGQGAYFSHPAVQGQNDKRVGGPDIVVAVRAADNRAHGIGGKAVVLVDDVHKLFVDDDGKAVVVCSDPEPPFLIHIQTVGISDRVQLIHPPKFRSVVAIKPGIGSNPQDAVRCLGNVVGLSAGKAVAAAVYGLDIAVIAVVSRLGRAAGKRENQAEGEQDAQGIRPPPVMPVQVQAPAPKLQHAKQQKQGENRQQLIQEVHIGLPDQRAQEPRKPASFQNGKHRVPEAVAGQAVIQQQVQRHGDQDSQDRRLPCDRHRPQKGIHGVIFQAAADDHRQCNACQAVSPGRRVGQTDDEVSRDADHRAADRSHDIGAQHRSEGVQPERQGQARAEQGPSHVHQDAQRGKKTDLPAFPVFHRCASFLKSPASRRSGHVGGTSAHTLRTPPRPG